MFHSIAKGLIVINALIIILAPAFIILGILQLCFPIMPELSSISFCLLLPLFLLKVIAWLMMSIFVMVEYACLVHKFVNRFIRVFLQDGGQNMIFPEVRLANVVDFEPNDSGIEFGL